MTTPTYLVFDTETTGLPPRGARGEPPIPADDPRQPRLAGFAGIVTDAFGRELERHKFYVRPEGWTMAEMDARAIAQGLKPASEVNGLTDDFLIDHGIPVGRVLDFYSGHITAGLIVVAFNAIFDTKIMRGELRRAGRPDLFEQTRNICVMRGLAPYARRGLPIMREFIMLSEACEWFGIVNAQAHDAMGDAEAARALLETMIADDLLPAPTVTYSKHHSAA